MKKPSNYAPSNLFNYSSWDLYRIVQGGLFCSYDVCVRIRTTSARNTTSIVLVVGSEFVYAVKFEEGYMYFVGTAAVCCLHKQIE